jgi:hypothetical protein
METTTITIKPVVIIITTKIMLFFGQVTSMYEIGSLYRMLIAIPKGNRQLKRTWIINDELNLKETESEPKCLNRKYNFNR